MDHERALDKARKLLAKAEGAATPEEADVYSAKAAEWIAKHGIDEVLLAASGAKTDHVEQRRIRIDEPYRTAKAYLLTSIASALRCHGIQHRTRHRGVDSCSVFGFTSDLERVEMLYTSLLLQATSQMVRLRPTWPGESVRAYRRNWLYGYTAAVYRRLEAAEKQAEQQALSHVDEAGTSTDLVLLDRNIQVQQAVNAAFPDLTRGRRAKLTGGGARAGYQAGQRADLGARRIDRQRRALGG